MMISLCKAEACGRWFVTCVLEDVYSNAAAMTLGGVWRLEMSGRLMGDQSADNVGSVFSNATNSACRFVWVFAKIAPN
jgi:hypothetical protein